MADEGLGNENTATTAAASFDEQSGSAGSSVDGQATNPIEIECPASAAPAALVTPESGSGDDDEGINAPRAPVFSAEVRRLSSDLGSSVLIEGQLRPIEMELSTHHRAFLGSYPSNSPDGGALRKSSSSFLGGQVELPPDERTRRDAVLRADCDYGMDAVGNYVAKVTEWVESAHVAEDTLSENENSGRGFRLPRALRSHTDQVDVPRVDDRVFPSNVGIDASLEMALAGLNSCLYEAERQRLEERSRDANDVAVNVHVGDVDRIIEAVARIPCLMKTILLIEDDDDRKFVVSNPVIRRTMLCPYSIMNTEAIYEDSRLKHAQLCSSLSESLVAASRPEQKERSWLEEMLKSSDRSLTDKAIDYIEMISSLSVNDYVSIRQPPSLVRHRGGNYLGSLPVSKRAPSPSKEDKEDFNTLRDSLFKTAGSLDLLIPLLFKLYQSDIERASTLSVIRCALDDAISRPFFMIIMFFDSIFHIILLTSFRFFNFQVVAARRGSDNYVESNYGIEFLGYLGIISAFYFGFRTLGNIISMSRITWHVFCANFFNIWQIVEVASVTMVLISLATLRVLDLGDILKYRGNALFVFNGITTGLLWLNFVGFLRVLNWKLATFVLAILQIIRDISLFLFLMLILILAFGDMFYTIIAADPAVCSNTENWIQFFLEKIGLVSSDDLINDLRAANGTVDGLAFPEEESPVCEDRGQSYFAIYRVLIGDVSADEFAHNPITTVLFIVMTFLGVIIMLNILIAIVDESYERSTMRADRLLGRARIALVAKISSLEELLHPRGPGFVCFSRGISRNFLLHNSMRILFFAMIAAIVATLVEIAETTHSAFQNLRLEKGASIALTTVVIIPFAMFILISSSFLLTGWEEGKTRFKLLQKFQYTRINRYCFMYPASFVVHNLLATSRSLQKNRSNEDAWHGRLNHLTQHVQTCVSESESKMKDVISRLEMKLEESEEQRRNDVIDFEKRLERMEDTAQIQRRRELEDLEKRISKAITVALSEQLGEIEGGEGQQQD